MPLYMLSSKFTILVSKGSEYQVDWSELPKRLLCYGRQTERHQLRQWLVEDGVALVGLFGLGGQGKTLLAAEVVWSLIANHSVPTTVGSPFARGPFEYVIWRSLVNAPPFATMLKSCLTYLTDGQVSQVPDHVDEQLALLFDYLRKHRCLLILDNFDCLLQPDSSMGGFLPGYEGYEQLIHQMDRRVHRSSLLLISREYPTRFDTSERDVSGFRDLYLRGLTENGARQLLESYGLSSNHTTVQALVERYGGHPLALKSVAETAEQLFDGNLEAFLTEETLILEKLRHLLDQQFATLSQCAKALLLKLADQSEPVSFQALWDGLSSPFEHSQLLNTLSALQRRSLLDIEAGTIRLPSVVTAYLITYMSPTLSQT